MVETVSRFASELGDSELAAQSYREALKDVGPESHIASRLMVAGLAEEIGSPGDLIELLDSRLPSEGYEPLQAALARAHANERPHRQRNIAFFERLPAAVRSRREIALAHASVLLDIDKASAALPILRQLHSEMGEDAYAILRLVDALRRTNEGGAREVLHTVRLDGLKGAPEHAMAVVQLVAAEGEPERAYPAAYDLVRKYPDRPGIALGYLGLGLMLLNHNPSFDLSVAGPGAYVKIDGPGVSRTFVIDEGPEFYGIAVESPNSAIAGLVRGKRVGDTFEIPKMTGAVELWRVSQVVSKYLQLQNRIMEEFEVRYPGEHGISRFTTNEEDITPVLDIVRRTGETNEKTARQHYLEGDIPLGLIARMMGGDPIGFAQYVRNLDGEIATCARTAEEQETALFFAIEFRGRGAVLDPYTAWVAAEIGLLPHLKRWFGSIHVPRLTLMMIEKLVAHERDGIGKRQMIVAWHDGQFYRHEEDDDFKRSQIRKLEDGRSKIERYCELHSILLPDEISETAEKILKVSGSHFLDAAWLSGRRQVFLRGSQSISGTLNH